MAQWEAPTTHNEVAPDDSGSPRQTRVLVYLDAVSGRYRLATGDVPVGATRVYFATRALDDRVVLRDDATDVRVPVLIGPRRVLV